MNPRLFFFFLLPIFAWSELTPGCVVYEQAGLSDELSYDLGLVGTAIAFLGVIVSWLYIAKAGRRTIWLYGSYALLVSLFLIGIMSCVTPQTKALGWAESIMCIVWLGSYSMSVGPIVYTIVSEIGSTRLRTQTVVLGRSMYYFANLIGGILEPYFMSPTAWDAKGKTVSTLLPGSGRNLLLARWFECLLTSCKGILLGVRLCPYYAVGLVPSSRDQRSYV